MVPAPGLEPGCSCERWILNPLRLPIPPSWLEASDILIRKNHRTLTDMFQRSCQDLVLITLQENQELYVQPSNDLHEISSYNQNPHREQKTEASPLLSREQAELLQSELRPSS